MHGLYILVAKGVVLFVYIHVREINKKEERSKLAR